MNIRASKPEAGSILLVDDKPTNLKVLSESLRHEEWVILVAPDGESALEQIALSTPDLILLDIRMPGIDGFETCQRLKNNPDTASIPIIFMTALSDTFDKVRGFQAGAVDYITKPFQKDEVMARVKLHFRLHQLAQQLQQKNRLLEIEIQERQEVEESLRLEQQKSERLLLNILPQEIVNHLKQFQGSLAERFDEATVLFADIVDFTTMAAEMRPLELVNMLNQIFSAFDRLAEKYGLEKIKTIGDAYMVVGGLPVSRPDHAQAIAEMALEMQQVIQTFSRSDGHPLQLRIGIKRMFEKSVLK
ncbi:MAG: response regulator [Cyanobacteria bacterium]|nr:response regulator [Cyanobacteriota bacterium]